MIAVPPDMPPTAPLSEPTDTILLVLLHSPPPTVSVRVILAPVHTPDGPVIAVGDKLTVTVILVLQPVVAVKVMLLVPVATPVTTPVVETIVAVAGVPLTHVPAPSVNVMCAPTHNADGPPIGAGLALIVTIAVLAQPVGNV